MRNWQKLNESPSIFNCLRIRFLVSLLLDLFLVFLARVVFLTDVSRSSLAKKSNLDRIEKMAGI